MKSLIFLRHGKSDWEADYQGDHNRPISARGRRASRLMGQFLRETGQVPDAVLTSTALRARQTVELAVESGSWDCPIRTSERLYGAYPQQVLDEVRTEPDSTRLLLLAGHEPACSGAIGLLVGGAAVRFPTAAMARIDFDLNAWRRLEFGKGRLIWLVTPKLLK